MLPTSHLLFPSDFPGIARGPVETLQVNLGYLCNQSCVHCHVNAGPKRTEVMGRDIVERVLNVLKAGGIGCLDLTGGAPELNPHFRWLVEAAVALGVRVIDRCNLTVLEEPGMEWLAGFLTDNRVEITASLPCYLEENVAKQRGGGVFESSVRALRRLNELGYGREGSGLVINLVYNPQGPLLPPPQSELEAAYRRELGNRFGIVFNHLFTLANMPIKRFGSMLRSKGQFDDYMNLLKASHREANLSDVMCRSLVSVDWQGTLYDCDFNQMLGLPMRLRTGRPLTLVDLLTTDPAGMPVLVGAHCYGCTAGQGSSCAGALDEGLLTP